MPTLSTFVRELPNTLDIYAQIISLGTDALLLIMPAMIETKGLSKSFQLFTLLRLGPHVSTPWRRVGVTSVSNNHSLVRGSWSCKCANCLSRAPRAACPRESHAQAASRKENLGHVSVTPRYV